LKRSATGIRRRLAIFSNVSNEGLVEMKKRRGQFREMDHYDAKFEGLEKLIEVAKRRASAHGGELGNSG
jgi:hypothetical protein